MAFHLPIILLFAIGIGIFFPQPGNCHFTLSTRCGHVEDLVRELLRVYDLYHFRYQNGYEFRENRPSLLACSFPFPSSSIVFHFRSCCYSFGYSLCRILGADCSVKDEGNDCGYRCDVLLSYGAGVGRHPRRSGLCVMLGSYVVRREFCVGVAAFRDE